MSRENYEANFCFPIPEALESERVKLTLFIAEHNSLPTKHADQFYEAITPSIFEHLPFGPFETVERFLADFVEGRVHANPACILFAVYDKTKATPGEPDGAFAGTIGLLNSSTANLVTEIGFVFMLPSFRRTHVTSNAVGILLRYTLNLPEAGGLGLRRVVWQANTLNGPSIKTAERMGFKREGTLRWHHVLNESKHGNGLERRKGDPRAKLRGRDTAVLGICWDDWEDGGRSRTDAVMARTG